MHITPIKQYGKLAFALAVVLIANTSFILSKNPGRNSFQLHKESGLIRTLTFKGKHYIVCEADPHQYKVELFNSLPNGKGAYTFKQIAKEKQQKLIFAMNAGMYEKDLSPVGLFIADGETRKEINVRTDASGNFYQLRPNGVLMIDINDDPFVLITESYIKQYHKVSHKVRIATQSGPMLVINGLFNTNFQANSINVNIRNGVGINSQHQVVFVISTDPVNFYEFAQLFKTELDCANALYLDGVISQYYAPELQAEPMPGVPLGTILTVSHK